MDSQNTEVSNEVRNLFANGFKKRRLAEEVPQVPSTMMSAARLGMALNIVNLKVNSVRYSVFESFHEISFINGFSHVSHSSHVTLNMCQTEVILVYVV